MCLRSVPPGHGRPSEFLPGACPPGIWVFPSPKNGGPRTTFQKSHQRAIRGRKNKGGEYEGGCGIECRLYDMRHTFATRLALAGGSLSVLAKISDTPIS